MEEEKETVNERGRQKKATIKRGRRKEWEGNQNEQ